MRMLSGAKLNGHYRVGPGVSDEGAFSDDSGTPTGGGGYPGGYGGGDGGGSGPSVTYGVATAQDPVTQIAGVDPMEGGSGAGVPDGTYHKVDDKTTEMPRFTAPYDADDLLAPPTVYNPPGTRYIPPPHGSPPGTPGMTVPTPPPAFDLSPGGYESIDVPGDQTLRLSAGVYYFKEGVNVRGKIEVAGGDPVIVFIGKKAVFDNAEINNDGSTSALQFCFTDEEKDPDVLADLVSSLLPDFELPAGTATTSTSPTTTSPFPAGVAGGGGSTTADTSPAATTLPEYVRQIVAPVGDPTDPETAEGASILEVNGGKVFATIAGKNLVVEGNGGEIFGGVMANVVRGNGTDIHQDLSLKGSNLMNSGGWALEGVHQLR